MLNAPSRSTSSRRAARLSVASRAEKNPAPPSTRRSSRASPGPSPRARSRAMLCRQRRHPPARRPPGASTRHLVRMNLVLGRDRLHGTVARSASSATRFLKFAVNCRRRFVVIPVPPPGSGIHLSQWSEKAGPPHRTRRVGRDGCTDRSITAGWTPLRRGTRGRRHPGPIPRPAARNLRTSAPGVHRTAPSVTLPAVSETAQQPAGNPGAELLALDRDDARDGGGAFLHHRRDPLADHRRRVGEHVGHQAAFAI